MSSIMRALSGLTGRWEGPEVIGGSFLELKVAGPSMLGIGCPDRHALPRITSSKMRRPQRLLPSRERVRRNLVVRAHLGEGPVCMLCGPPAHKSDGPLQATSPIAIAVSLVAVKSRAPAQANRLGQAPREGERTDVPSDLT